MELLPTAEELLLADEENTTKTVWTDIATESMIEFAKLHVRAALKAASEVELDDTSLMPKANDFEESRELSILNSYPENLIK